MSVHRFAKVDRKTKETDISISVDLDGVGSSTIDTKIPFFDHMLDAFSRHSLIDMDLRVDGDIEVDAHHSVEDAGIVLGCAIKEALGDKVGITRFGSFALPMDEALILCSLDISGRGQLFWDEDIPVDAISTFDTQLAKEFFVALASNAGITLHLQQLAGENAHHLIEATFKACGRALRQALEIDPRVSDVLPSTKGAL